MKNGTASDLFTSVQIVKSYVRGVAEKCLGEEGLDSFFDGPKGCRARLIVAKNLRWWRKSWFRWEVRRAGVDRALHSAPVIPTD